MSMVILTLANLIDLRHIQKKSKATLMIWETMVLETLTPLFLLLQ